MDLPKPGFYTLALSRHTIDEAIDSQVCFHRRSFVNPIKPWRSTTRSMGPLMGTNKAAWSVKLLLMTVLSHQGWLWQCLCPAEDIALLFASLWMVLPAFGFPPTSNIQPTPLLPAYPLWTSSLILQEFKKLSQKTSSVSCVTKLVIKTLAVAITTLPMLWIWHPYSWASTI